MFLCLKKKEFLCQNEVICNFCHYEIVGKEL